MTEAQPTILRTPDVLSAMSQATTEDMAGNDPMPRLVDDAEAALAALRLMPPERRGSFGRINDYEVLNYIGRGGMGIVVRAFDEQLHRNVAVKVMAPEYTSKKSARERFVREARAAAGINHPNVVVIHAVSEHAGMPFLVMEYVDGRSLHQRVKSDAPMDPFDIVRISAQIASGMAAAHQHGIIHRDIKPGQHHARRQHRASETD